jgi:hypothetical protein
MSLTSRWLEWLSIDVNNAVAITSALIMKRRRAGEDAMQAK